MKEIVCPICGKKLLIVDETKDDKFTVRKKIKIWCKRCSKEVSIEI
jgi:hypothetical protein